MSKIIGERRRVDDIGRLLIPKAIRDDIRVKQGEEFEFTVVEGDILMKRIRKENSTIMTLDDYQALSMRTMRSDTIKNTLLNCSLGMSGETGEVVDLVKKFAFQGHELNEPKIKEEIGDVLFYIANMCTALEISMQEAMEENVAKLEKRFPNGFNVEDSIKRVDVQE